MQIGIAGLGRMGAAIAARLMEVGHTLTVWNRSPEKIKPLAEKGARAAKTPAEVAGSAETIITILTDPEQSIVQIARSRVEVEIAEEAIAAEEEEVLAEEEAEVREEKVEEATEAEEEPSEE